MMDKIEFIDERTKLLHVIADKSVVAINGCIDSHINELHKNLQEDLPTINKVVEAVLPVIETDVSRFVAHLHAINTKEVQFLIQKICMLEQKLEMVTDTLENIAASVVDD
jgi:hypothetical protein